MGVMTTSTTPMPWNSIPCVIWSRNCSKFDYIITYYERATDASWFMCYMTVIECSAKVAASIRVALKLWFTVEIYSNSNKPIKPNEHWNANHGINHGHFVQSHGCIVKCKFTIYTIRRIEWMSTLFFCRFEFHFVGKWYQKKTEMWFE